MSEGKRKSSGKDKARRRYRQDGTPIWGQRTVDGPGVWVTCVKGKEKQTVGELYDLFESLASEMWPDDSATGTQADDDNSDDEGSDDGDIEKQLAKEVASMKRPRKEQRFANCQINTPCVVFISCKPPVDPVKLVMRHVENVAQTGVTHTRYTQRLTPVSATCAANIPEICSLCNRIANSFFESDLEKTYTYKIELRIRNHNTVTRSQLIEELAKCVSERHKVDLNNPEVFILVEIFKSVCGISVVNDYYTLHKFNVMEIANAKNATVEEQGRVADKTVTSEPSSVKTDGADGAV
ncbi:uncharacterized protein LAESUDRAFT_744987 [Laetiporus sulphureus 93-53]|uniref:THUMP domain-containing protein n=1 Tax=Laetiporus sulphureus 93-53 TaxID=1314785 RepID=A0A165CDH7_9APHY|nr:uncharacterized protein LAESUDRAFT_744987 [Laetiporus sulphureus 93-53]KZT02615.1 hypothetical protein LAESUDRAFT_744987 [Laetiporus sulphureus 93-53]